MKPLCGSRIGNIHTPPPPPHSFLLKVPLLRSLLFLRISIAFGGGWGGGKDLEPHIFWRGVAWQFFEILGGEWEGYLCLFSHGRMLVRFSAGELHMVIFSFTLCNFCHVAIVGIRCCKHMNLPWIKLEWTSIRIK